MSATTAQIPLDDFHPGRQHPYDVAYPMGFKLYPHPQPPFPLPAAIEPYSKIPAFNPVDPHGPAYNYLDQTGNNVILGPYISGPQLGFYDAVALGPSRNALLYPTNYSTGDNFAEPSTTFLNPPPPPLPSNYHQNSSRIAFQVPPAGFKGRRGSGAQNDILEPPQAPTAPWMLSGSLDLTTGTFQRSAEHTRLRTAQACEKCRLRKAKVRT